MIHARAVGLAGQDVLAAHDAADGLREAAERRRGLDRRLDRQHAARPPRARASSSDSGEPERCGPGHLVRRARRPTLARRPTASPAPPARRSGRSVLRASVRARPGTHGALADARRLGPSRPGAGRLLRIGQRPQCVPGELPGELAGGVAVVAAKHGRTQQPGDPRQPLGDLGDQLGVVVARALSAARSRSRPRACRPRGCPPRRSCAPASSPCATPAARVARPARSAAGRRRRPARAPPPRRPAARRGPGPRPGSPALRRAARARAARAASPWRARPREPAMRRSGHRLPAAPVAAVEPCLHRRPFITRDLVETS